MTLRHWTGSVKLIELLSGLGHSVSNTFVLEHDTALANKQLQSNRLTPEGFKKKKRTTLIFDNSDFREETLSGKGTTHCTSSVIVQQHDEHDDACSQALQPHIGVKLAKPRCRSLQTPHVELPVCVQPKRTGPEQTEEPVDTSRDIWQDVIGHPLAFNQLYNLAKLPDVQTQMLPSWTAFNIAVQQGRCPPVSKIGYLPMIDSSPTNMSTVLAILHRGIQVADELELNDLDIVFDQATYAKAQVIRWQNPDFKRRLVLRLGEFHTSINFLAMFGKRFEDSGIKEVLVGSGIVAEGSVAGVLNGTVYNRSIRCFKLLAESLSRLQWGEFIDSLPQEEQDPTLYFAAQLNDSYPFNFKDLIDLDQGKQLVTTFQAHRAQSCSENPNYALWNSLIELVEILLLFVRGTREGNFELHLASVRSMLPWFFAYDRQNYARFLTIDWYEMMQLETTHPEIYASFCAGQFVVQRHADQPFSQLACDVVIEQTINRESKIGGGLTGITQMKGAVHRWLLARLPRAENAAECRKMAGHKDKEHGNKDLGVARMETDERDVRQLTATIKTVMSDPFTLTHPSMLNISTGVLADPSVMDDLLTAQQEGEKACLAFSQERLETRQTDIFAPIPKRNLKTFFQRKADPKKQKISSVKASRALTTRILLACKVRDISLRSVLKHNE